MPVGSVGSQKVKTIEGLSDDGSHILQKAWKKHGVPQCGYCQPGQIMNAAAMLIANPRPSNEEIQAHMQGNLCRCGTYARINRALEDIAQNPLSEKE